MNRWAQRVVAVIVAAFLMWMVPAIPPAAFATPTPTIQTDTYDGHHDAALFAGATTERGPPDAHDVAATDNAVDHWSHSASLSPWGVGASGYTDYDMPVSLAKVDNPTATTSGQAQAFDGALSSVARSHVAAKSLSGLERGAAKVPGEWGPGLANRDLGGTRWFDPAAPKANGIRIDAAVPNSSFPSQQVDHVIVRSGGRILGRDGKPIVGSLKQNPDAHIPLSDWLNWGSWNAP